MNLVENESKRNRFDIRKEFTVNKFKMNLIDDKTNAKRVEYEFKMNYVQTKWQ